MIAAGELVVLVVLGYLLLRGQAAGHNHAANRRLESHVRADNSQRQAWLQMLSYAVKTLQTKNDQVYLDAGYSNWVSGLWIKAPGESDGDCGVGAGTQVGEFSPVIAKELITGGHK